MRPVLWCCLAAQLWSEFPMTRSLFLFCFEWLNFSSFFCALKRHTHTPVLAAVVDLPFPVLLLRSLLWHTQKDCTGLKTKGEGNEKNMSDSQKGSTELVCCIMLYYRNVLSNCPLLLNLGVHTENERCRYTNSRQEMEKRTPRLGRRTWLWRAAAFFACFYQSIAP